MLPVLFFFKQIFKTKVVIDIHNFGYSLLESNSLILKKILHFQEIFWTRLTGDRIFAVSEAMKKELQDKWRISDIVTLYDKPNTKLFKKLSLQEKHDFFF